MTSGQEPFPMSIQRLRGAFGALGRAMLDLLLPIACGGCGREGDLFCSACRAATPLMPAPRCLHCDMPLPAGDIRCLRCARRPLHHLAGLRTDYPYTGPLRRAILALKYRSLHALAEPLGELLVDTWERRPLRIDLVVPIPLHPRRERSRGFNQAALLSQLVARDCGLPLAAHGLVRLRDTPPPGPGSGRASSPGTGGRRLRGARRHGRTNGAAGGRRVYNRCDAGRSGARLP